MVTAAPIPQQSPEPEELRINSVDFPKSVHSQINVALRDLEALRKTDVECRELAKAGEALLGTSVQVGQSPLRLVSVLGAGRNGIAFRAAGPDPSEGPVAVKLTRPFHLPAGESLEEVNLGTGTARSAFQREVIALQRLKNARVLGVQQLVKAGVLRDSDKGTATGVILSELVEGELLIEECLKLKTDPSALSLLLNGYASIVAKIQSTIEAGVVLSDVRRHCYVQLGKHLSISRSSLIDFGDALLVGYDDFGDRTPIQIALQRVSDDARAELVWLGVNERNKPAGFNGLMRDLRALAEKTANDSLDLAEVQATFSELIECFSP